MESITPYTKEQIAALRQGYRSDSLVAVLCQFNLTLPRNAHEWRVPPEPESGYILGVTHTSVRLLCTDGILGWFAWDDGSVILGHMQRWEKDEVPKEKKSKKKIVLPDVD